MIAAGTPRPLTLTHATCDREPAPGLSDKSTAVPVRNVAGSRSRCLKARFLEDERRPLVEASTLHLLWAATARYGRLPP